MCELQALVRAHRTVREALTALVWKTRHNVLRAAAVDAGHEAMNALGIAMIVRPDRLPAAVADAQADVDHFVQLAGRLHSEVADPVRAVLAELAGGAMPTMAEQGHV